MNSNFSFIFHIWQEIAETAAEAEKFALTAPVTSAFYSRLALEKIVNWLYENDADLVEPYETTLSACMYEQSFKDIIPPSIYKQLSFIRKEGNNAVHGKKVTQYSAVSSLKFLHRFLCWLSRIYTETPVEPDKFDENFIPKTGNGKRTIAQLHALQKEHDNQQKQLAEERRKLLEKEEELARVKQELEEIKERKEARQHIPTPANPYTEAETRNLFIDELLRETSWDAETKDVVEFEIQGMPEEVNPTGIGYVDYVLWGDNGLPLALVEAKRTTVDLDAGKIQSFLYANCLEQMFGQRPIIFCTNGYDTFIWDDLFYSQERSVQGLYTKSELQLIIDRRNKRRDIRNFPINNTIVNRYYQKEAIKRIAEELVVEDKGKLWGKKRKALVVMATGAGKTRTAAALVDVLEKAHWAKRVLFLADRNALVRQAKNAFKTHVPSLSAIDLTQERQDESTRLVFSTYPTIMNRIDQSRNEDLRFYSPGHFDIIIVDEAHRSIYQKYRAIFEYFDSLLVGLTATPKNETDHDTYHLFDCEEDVPTYYYELDQAVDDKYLLLGKGQPVDLGFIKRGIKYDELSEEDKVKYEQTFRDEEGNFQKEIGGSAINQWLFNKNTIDKVIDYFMTNGIKVEGGDKIGKSIIFARNHKHAEHIEKRFKKQYPELGPNFIQIIDNYDRYAQTTLNNFSEKNRQPQIAISVDMLDTGIDIHEIVNLVFFKPVYSKAKFWQMIGRGTRLCADLFGPGEDKEMFYIFDFCCNFEFFDINPEGIERTNSKSLSQRIFETRILISEELRDINLQEEKYINYRIKLLDLSHTLIDELWKQKSSFRIKTKLRYVDKYKDRNNWDNLTEGDITELFEHLGNLVAIDDDDELAKRFDLLMYNLQLAQLRRNPERTRYAGIVTGIAQNLLRISNIPAIKNKLGLIQAIADEYFFKDDIELANLEEIRENIRELVKLIKKDEQKIYLTDLKDTITPREIFDIVSEFPKNGKYLKKVGKFIRDHKYHLTITKLRNNQPITTAELAELERIVFDGEERGTLDDYNKETHNKPLGIFIRSIVGLDVHVAKKAFSNFIDETAPTANQIKFINTIIEHLEQNGIIDPGMLYEVPFTNIDDQGIEGVFDENQANKVFQIINELANNAIPLKQGQG